MTPSLATIDARLDTIHDGATGDLTLDQVTAATGLSTDAVTAIWRALGRTELGAATTLGDTDLRLLRLIGSLATTADPAASDLTRLRPVLRTVRAATHALRRVSDAHVTARLEHLSTEADRADLIDDVDHSGDTVEAVLLALWRHELRQSLARALSTADNPTQPLLAVGFIDLAGYSARSQQLPTADLVELIDRFDTTAVEVTADNGATIVKTIGDEIMYTHPSPAGGARVALELLDRCDNDDVMLAARAGLAWGRPIALGGDYYGPSVNLAARLVQLARPNTALIDADLARQLDPCPEFDIGPMRARELRHCGTHHVHTLRRSRLADRRPPGPRPPGEDPTGSGPSPYGGPPERRNRPRRQTPKGADPMTDTEPTEKIDYRRSAATSRTDRDASLVALHALEAALAGPAPGRHQVWLQRVLTSLDTLDRALDIQGATDGETTSLLSEIARNEPRLVPRIERLRQEYDDIRVSLHSLRDQITPVSAAGGGDVDVADVRDRLSAIARRYRQHRSREADLVYEAINVDLGAAG